MSLERDLRDHFDATAQRLPDPEDSFADVARRGRRRRNVERAAIGLCVLLAVAAVPAIWSSLENRSVEFEPITPAPVTPEETPEPTPDPEPSPGPTPDPEPTPDPAALPASVLAFGHDRDVALIEAGKEQVLWPGTVDAAFGDGRAGAVLVPSSEPVIRWVPGDDAASETVLADVDGELALRGLLPDGRVLYSVRPPDDMITEGDTEDFFAVELTEGAEPELVASAGAYETSTIGPAVAADGDLVAASCHIHCSLRRWPDDSAEDDEALYHGGGESAGPTKSIDGLSATPDGLVLAFVEFDPVVQADPPELVLLAGTSFGELGRIPLPLEPDEDIGHPVVSLSGDGQRILVTLGSATPPPDFTAPTAPYLVDGALTDDPRIDRVEVEGALRWADPGAAAGPGGPTTAEERDVAERLMAFARNPDDTTFADAPLADHVALGLGPDLLGPPRPAGELTDPAAWELDPDEGFRAYVGPFSALALLAGAGEVEVTGGPHRHCASPPTPVPDEVAGLRQISIQTSGEDSCLEWFTVDLFLDDEGDIAGVTLDLWEP